MSAPLGLVASVGGKLPPLWSVAPFALTLLGIAILPLVAHHWWESNRNRAVFAWGIAIPTALWWLLAGYGFTGLSHAWLEYVSFILLLGSLYVAAGGIFVQASLRGSPGTNTALCLFGGVLANFVGTTGASMLLIRPFMKANAWRPMPSRMIGVVFFIFLVSNIGGCLTPLGDPPLFLGFLKGVPFQWTLTHLWREWVIAFVLLLSIFYLWDSALRRKYKTTLAPQEGERLPFRIEGRRNVLLLLAIVGAVLGKGLLHWPFGVQEGIMAAVVVLSMATTPRAVRTKNRFTFGPIVEVAILFSGIFTVMVPALAILEAKGGEMGLSQPWHYFWATGSLSAFLDNAPTYLVFAQTGAAQVGAASIRDLVTEGPGLLAAVSIGAVFMGAMSYIGNGPNFMVKAIAEEGGIVMPSFFGYMKYSCLILLPLFALVTLLCFL